MRNYEKGPAWHEIRRSGNDKTHRPEIGNDDVAADLGAGIAVLGLSPDPGRTLPSDLVRVADHMIVLDLPDLELVREVTRRVTSAAPTDMDPTIAWADLVTVNPFQGLAQPGRERARDRVLSECEVRLIWAACESLGDPHRAFVRFLLLTLQRRSEVAGARWEEMAADLSTWTIPADRAKNGRAHRVHLAPAAREILTGLARGTDQPMVFALPGGTQITAFSVIKKAIDARVAKLEAEAAAEVGREPVVVLPWTFHDFRRAGVTMLANSGTPPHVADRLLNHVTGTIQGVAAVYQRTEFLAERKAALEAWAGFVIGL